MSGVSVVYSTALLLLTCELMCANTLNFSPAGQDRISGVHHRRRETRSLLCVLQWSSVHFITRELDLQIRLMLFFFFVSLFVTCCHSVHWPSLLNGSKTSDTGLQVG